MSSPTPQIPNSLFFSLVFIPVLSYSFLYFPLTGVLTIGGDGYLALPLAMLMTLPLLLLAHFWAKQNNGQTILEQAPLIIGRIPGLLFNLVYLAFLFGETLVFSREVVSLAADFALGSTPRWAITLFLIGATVYLSCYGIPTVARLATFLLPAVLVIFFLVLLGFQHWDWRNMEPLFRSSPRIYLAGGWQNLYLFYPLGLVYQASSFSPNHKSAFRLSLLVLFLTTALYLLTFIGVLGVFSTTGLTRYNWPTLQYTRTINMEFLLLEQAGLLLLLAWGVLSYSTITIFLAFLAHGLSQVWPELSARVSPLLLGAFLIAGVLFIPNINHIRHYINLFQLGGFLALFLLPAGLWIIALIKRRKPSA